MGIFDRLFKNAIEPDKPVKKNIISQMRYNYILRTEQDISSWRLALQRAEDPNHPSRYELQMLYKEIENDDEVATQLEKAHNRIMASKFCIYQGEKVNEELTALFQNQWFDDLTKWVMESKYYGNSLIQFGNLVKGEYVDNKLVPRFFVVPEKGTVQRFYGDTGGIPFNEGIYAPNLISVGTDLGLFNKIAPLYIYKKNALAFWANYQERFGEPIVSVQTDLTNDQNVKELQGFLNNFSESAYVIADKEDIITMLESGKSDAYKVFENMISLINASIAKVIDGNTMTSSAEGGNYKGEVHEKTSEMYHYSRLGLIERVVNKKLIPKMVKDGFPLINTVFGYREQKDVNAEVERIVKLKNAGYVVSADQVQEITGYDIEEQEMEPNKSVMKDVEDLYKGFINGCDHGGN